MRGLRILMMILLTTVFAVGGPLRVLPAHARTAPPCHQTAASPSQPMVAGAHGKALMHKSGSDALAMSCCAGCLPATVRDIAPVATPDVAVRIAFTPISQAFAGLSVAPDHDPPRPLA